MTFIIVIIICFLDLCTHTHTHTHTHTCTCTHTHTYAHTCTHTHSHTHTHTVPPIIQPAVLPVIANEGSRAVLDCVATGNPPPTVSWFFNSVPLPSPSIPRIQQASNGSLILSPVEGGDEGGYICRARNIAGMESATFQLRVYGNCSSKSVLQWVDHLVCPWAS